MTAHTDSIAHAPATSPWRAVLPVLSQTAVLVALLFYYGWVRTSSTFDYFGIDTSLLKFTTADFVLRSVTTGYRPLVAAVIAALALTLAHHGLVVLAQRRTWQHRRALRSIPAVLLAVGATLGVATTVVLLTADIPRLGAAAPILLCAGAAVLWYAEYSWPIFRGSTWSIGGSELRRFFLGTIVVLGSLWWIALFGHTEGRRRAQEIAHRLPYDTEVALYSKERLAIPAFDGVREERFGDEALKYRYRYTGLRLLVQAGGYYVLAPAGWKRGQSAVSTVPVQDDVRLDLITAR